MQNKHYHLYGVGNALLDAEFLISEDFIRKLGIIKGRMFLVDAKVQDETFKLLKDHKAQLKSGGSAANTLVGLSQYGARCFYSGRIGEDELGGFYYKDMRASGVYTNVDLKRGEEATGSALALITEDAERTFQTNLGASKSFSKENLSLEDIDKSEYFYIEGYLMSEENAFDAVMYGIDRSLLHSGKLILSFSDANIVEAHRDRLSEILKKGVEILFCNKEEALAFTKEKDLEKALKALSKLSRIVLVTLGDQGVVLVENRIKIAQIPSVPVTALDTNGAGDFFAASFIYALISGKDSLAASHFANFAASEIVQVHGPRLAREEVKRIKGKYLC